MRQLSEAPLAVDAAVWFDAQVYSQVLGQVGRIHKGLGAVRTLVGLGLCVRFRMNLHVRLGEEGQWTNFTPASKHTTCCRLEPEAEVEFTCKQKKSV